MKSGGLRIEWVYGKKESEYTGDKLPYPNLTFQPLLRRISIRILESLPIVLKPFCSCVVTLT